jgi:hypothetical protein
MLNNGALISSATLAIINFLGIAGAGRVLSDAFVQMKNHRDADAMQIIWMC